LVLSDPAAMVLREHREDLLPHRAGSVTEVAGAADERLYQVRTLVIQAIQERSLPLGQRIASLEFALERLAGADLTRAVMIMESHLSGIRQGLFADIFAGRQADPALQIETVVELIVARIGADYTSPRFLDCYREFMSGLAWTKESTMEELAARYRQASERYFQPFARRHEHLLENYLVNYVFRTLFPYRRKQPNGTFAIDSGRESMKNAYLLLVSHYAIVRTVLIGMAAFHKDDLGIDHAVKLVQSYSKAFLHSSPFEAIVIESLGNDTKFPLHKIAALVMD
jgi:lysine-N-methylase